MDVLGWPANFTIDLRVTIVFHIVIKNGVIIVRVQFFRRLVYIGAAPWLVPSGKWRSDAGPTWLDGELNDKLR